METAIAPHETIVTKGKSPPFPEKVNRLKKTTEEIPQRTREAVS